MSYSHKRQSQVIVNFFTLVSIVIITVVLTLYVKYGPKQKHIHSNLPCQKLTYTYDKISDKKQLNKAFNLMSQGAYVLDGGFIRPRFGKSYLKDEITLSAVDTFYKLEISKEPIDRNLFLKIKYEIIENDKNDPRKSENDKNYAGTLITSFRINQSEIFRMYTEFLDYDKSEIKEKISCTIKAFKYNAQK